MLTFKEQINLKEHSINVTKIISFHNFEITLPEHSENVPFQLAYCFYTTVNKQILSICILKKNRPVTLSIFSQPTKTSPK